MRILLTGSTGFLGSQCQKFLRERPNVLLHVLRTHPELCGLPPSDNTYRLDAGLSPNGMERMMSAPPTHIIHLAALSSPERCEEDPAQAVSSNVAMTETIASYADRVGAHLITASTDLVFDGLARGVPITDCP